MTKKQRAAASIDDPETFDVDGWIDGYVRPETVVDLYPYQKRFEARLAEIEKQIDELGDGEDRGINDPSPEALLAQVTELRAERDAATMRVRIRQLTDAEMVAQAMRAKESGAKAGDERVFWGLAMACVEPALTPKQILRLSKRDRSGEAMVNQLIGAVNALMAGGPEVPSSPER